MNPTNYATDPIIGYTFAKRLHRKVSQYLQEIYLKKLDKHDPIEKIFDVKWLSDDWLIPKIKLVRPCIFFNPLSANPTKWSNTLEQFIGNSRRLKSFSSKGLKYFSSKVFKKLLGVFRNALVFSTFLLSASLVHWKVLKSTPNMYLMVKNVPNV